MTGGSKVKVQGHTTRGYVYICIYLVLGFRHRKTARWCIDLTNCVQPDVFVHMFAVALLLR